MDGIIERADLRLKVARSIIEDLGLIEKWKRYGRPIIVGSCAYQLVVSPDIDMEIYCPDLKIEHGFQVLSECALNPRVKKARFVNALFDQDKALYWQLQYQYKDGTMWKVDMWSADEDYDLPRSEDLVEPMKKALTLETKKAILFLKESRLKDSSIQCLSIDLYRAVLDAGIRNVDDFRDWLKDNKIGKLTNWKPC